MKRSLHARVLDLALRSTVKRFLARRRHVGPHTVAASRNRLEALGRRLPEPPPGVQVTPANAAGIPALWVSAPGADASRIMLYLHGGAYTVGSASLYRDLAWRLSRAARARLLVIDYRLAPEHPFPAALEDAVSAWRWLLELGMKPTEAIIAGDSAGGGLALATLLALRDSGEPLPATAVCLSPWTDLTGSGASVDDNKRRDPLLAAHLLPSAAELYLAGADPRTPLASPLFGDLSGLPPLLLHASNTEILLSDSTRFADKARAAGVDVTLTIWERMPHVFHLFAAKLPEGREAIRDVGMFVNERLQGQRAGPPN